MQMQLELLPAHQIALEDPHPLDETTLSPLSLTCVGCQTQGQDQVQPSSDRFIIAPDLPKETKLATKVPLFFLAIANSWVLT